MYSVTNLGNRASDQVLEGGIGTKEEILRTANWNKHWCPACLNLVAYTTTHRRQPPGSNAGRICNLIPYSGGTLVGASIWGLLERQSLDDHPSHPPPG